MKTYKAVFRPDDNGWWFIDVPELPGCHSQARAIASGRDHIREAISLVANVDLDTFDVEVDYELPKAQQAAVAKPAWPGRGQRRRPKPPRRRSVRCSRARPSSGFETSPSWSVCPTSASPRS